MTDAPNTVACFRHIPDGQKVVFKLEPKHGELMKASTIGAAIRNVGKLLTSLSTAKIVDEEAFVTGMRMNDSGGIEIEFSVLPRDREDVEDSK